MIDLTTDQFELGVITHDHPAMARFYGEVLGLELVGSFPVPGVGTRHKYRLGRNSIKLIELATPLPDRPRGGLPWEATGLRYWTVHVRDLDAVLALLPAEAQLLPLTLATPPIRYAIVADPDGNALELVEGA
jgi:catechol 2,3-dioxygenase-like lactoylglutathione lyase family enzyme